jgi:hypothetical protein
MEKSVVDCRDEKPLAAAISECARRHKRNGRGRIKPARIVGEEPGTLFTGESLSATLHRGVIG